jgi:STE24 endopeptidase
VTNARRAAALTFTGLGLALLITLALTTPWQPLPGQIAGHPPAGAVTPDPARDFTAAQLTRSASFSGDLRGPAYLGLAAELLSVLAIGLTPLGARLLGMVTRPVRRWPLQVVAASLTLTVVLQVVALPFDAWSETVLRRYGLSTQDWTAWTLDWLRSSAIAAIMWIVVFLLLHLLVRRFPRYWWAPAAMGGFLLVVAFSFLYPVIVEPVRNSFTPMKPGPLRTELLRLAASDHVPVRDVLVADASRRTTALNAYVSGFGSTRRIVVYDTLLTSASPGEIKLIAAHELGHAKRGDVLHGTLIGALGASAGICLLYLATTSRRVLSRVGVTSMADPRAIFLVVAVVTVLTQLAGPAENLVTRRIEARADVHALDLTRDPVTFVRMQRTLSVRNVSGLRPDPVAYVLWATHPTGPERIAMARTWARLHQVGEPPSLVP